MFTLFKKKKAAPALAQPAAHVATQPVEGERSHAEIMVIIFALMTAMLLAALDQTIVSTALPTIASDLHGLNKLSWVATAYLLASAVVTPIYGKVSDLLGRKKVFQFAIIVFLIGSVLCGLAQNMNQLVAFRAIQGLGGGGLISLALAVVGDIVPPRERGRYQGYFGAVFVASSVLGPLLGGLFTEHLSWRWIFYINLPVGLIALAAIAARLHLPVRKSEHRFDVLGSVLMAGTVVCLLLALTLGGTTYHWGSDQILGLFAGSIAFLAAFIAHETRAVEPLIPLRLFRSSIFTVSAILSLLSGMVMLGAIIFLPEYQQVVRGDTPTKSGLLLLPLVFGLLGASTISGRTISKIGRYRMFPIFGTGMLALALWLFTHIKVDTSQFVLSIWMIVFGVGLGSFMQVMTLAVQNSAPRKDLGTATSFIVFCRSLGGSLGTAVFGVILTNRLTHHLAETLPAGADSAAAKGVQSSAAQLHMLPPAIMQDVLEAFTRSFHDVFWAAIPVALLAFVVAQFLKESPLKESTREMAAND